MSSFFYSRNFPALQAGYCFKECQKELLLIRLLFRFHFTYVKIVPRLVSKVPHLVRKVQVNKKRSTPSLAEKTPLRQKTTIYWDNSAAKVPVHIVVVVTIINIIIIIIIILIIIIIIFIII